MRNLFTIGCVAFLMSITGYVAQAQQTDPVTVNIDLTAEVISIDLGADPTVNFVYTEAADYAEEQVVTKPGHLIVVSNEPYNIAVSAQGPFTSTSNDPVDLGVVTVAVDEGTPNGGELTPVVLSATDAVLVAEADATTTATYDVHYSIPDASTLLDVAREIYTTTVVYTATQL